MEQITIKEVAKLCGVGVSTVSRAINNHPDINEETKQKVLETIQKYNYVPNNSARNLKRSDSNTIAVLIKGISNPFFSEIVQVFEREITKQKYSFVLQHVEEFEDEVDIAIQLEKEKRLKGIVFLGGLSYHTEKKLKQLTSRSWGVDMDHRLRRIEQVLRGWVNYFRIGKFKGVCERIDKNLRYRLRMCIWKQWKTVGRRYKALRQLGMEKETAWKWANSRKGYARVASSPILTYTVTNERLAKRGLASMTDLYQKINKTCLA